MVKKKSIDVNNSIKVLVTPWEKGFTCGIVMDSKAKMSTEEYEVCSTIARGMIKMATADPQTTFMHGLRGFANDKKNNKSTLSINSIAEFDTSIFFFFVIIYTNIFHNFLYYILLL